MRPRVEEREAFRRRSKDLLLPRIKIRGILLQSFDNPKHPRGRRMGASLMGKMFFTHQNGWLVAVSGNRPIRCYGAGKRYGKNED